MNARPDVAPRSALGAKTPASAQLPAHRGTTPPCRVSNPREAAAFVFARAHRQRSGALLVAISGVDGSGKTRLASELADELDRAGLRVALIGVDPWQNPQSVRFADTKPAAHFYAHAIRFDALFSQVIDPLVERRRLRLDTTGIRTDADTWYDLVYDYEAIDVVLLEGIFLFRRDLVRRYDLRIWVDCPMRIALERALARNVENRPLARLREDYARIYHAAQRLHFAADAPQAAADLVLDNTAPNGARR